MWQIAQISEGLNTQTLADHSIKQTSTTFQGSIRQASKDGEMLFSMCVTFYAKDKCLKLKDKTMPDIKLNPF